MNNNTGRPLNFQHALQSTWSKVLMSLFLSIVTILTACGNGLILWALKRFISLRKPGHIYLGGLALADLFMIVPLLLKITNILTRNKSVCVLQGITELITVCCVSLHLGCISIERFISIKFALRYDSIVTKPKIYITVVVIWIVSIVAAFIVPLAIHSDHFGSLADGIVTLCSPEKKNRMTEMPQYVFAYAVFMLCFFFCLPCLMILISYTYIFIASCRQRQKIVKLVAQDQSRWNAVTKRLLGDFKAARTLFIMQALFIVTYFPYFAVTIERIERDEHEEKELFYVSKSLSLLTALTSCLNPVIYVSGNEQFKTAFKKLLGVRVNHEQESTTSQPRT